MTRKKIEPTRASSPPVRGPRAATFGRLLETAMKIIQQDGHVPSVAETAARAGVSRATAYRCFSSRSALLTAVIDASLGNVRSYASNLPDARARVRALFQETFPRFKEYEPQMRAAAQLALEQWAQERAGLLEETPYRRGHRVHILEHALAPLKQVLSAAEHGRLHRALSLVYGIEPYIIFKDIWGASDREVERIALWMADALLQTALREAGIPSAPRVTAKRPRVKTLPRQ
jgi:AcrR family transcriptional regulator